MKEQKNNNQNIYNILITLLLTMSLVYAINLNNIFKIIRIYKYSITASNLLY